MAASTPRSEPIEESPLGRSGRVVTSSRSQPAVYGNDEQTLGLRLNPALARLVNDRKDVDP